MRMRVERTAQATFLRRAGYAPVSSTVPIGTDCWTCWVKNPKFSGPSMIKIGVRRTEHGFQVVAPESFEVAA